MIVAIYIFVAIVVVGIILRTTDRFWRADGSVDVDCVGDAPVDTPHDAECCGLHTVCSRRTPVDTAETAEYFDDEELDCFRGRPADQYSAEETDQFRHVLLTLMPGEAMDWERAIRARGIELPVALRDEFIIIASDK